MRRDEERCDCNDDGIEIPHVTCTMTLLHFSRNKTRIPLLLR